MMLKSVLIVVALALQFGCPGDFGNAAIGNALVSPVIECSGAVYEGACFERRAVLPDGHPGGTTLGPLSISRKGGVIHGVLLSLEITHPQTADFGATLHYDADNDGAYEASSPVEIYLARRDPCEGEELWACPVELKGTYFFKDESWSEFGESASFEVFEGLPSGGSFYLTVADNSTGDVGSVESWSVFVEKAADLARK